MPAESNSAAHLAVTATSANPVWKSSFKGKTTRSHAHSKEALYGPAAAHSAESSRNVRWGSRASVAPPYRHFRSTSLKPTFG
jgi:hypothetical protein